VRKFITTRDFTLPTMELKFMEIQQGTYFTNSEKQPHIFTMDNAPDMYVSIYVLEANKGFFLETTDLSLEEKDMLGIKPPELSGEWDKPQWQWCCTHNTYVCSVDIAQFGCDNVTSTLTKLHE
jgi:hypothetical protein